MKYRSDSIKKFILLGLSFFLFKSVLIVFAYVFSKEQYNLFNQSYYTASLVILFGTLGFDISQARIPIKTLSIFSVVLINIIFAYVILHLISNPFNDLSDIVSIIIYSLFSTVGGILNFKLLFDGKYERYFLIMLLFAIAHFAIIPVVLVLHFNIFKSLAVFTVIWFLVVYRLFDNEKNAKNKIDQYYKIGFSAFVINSAVSLALAGDKFIANHFFTLDIANAYTFAWGLTAPIFYIGTLIEKFLYAEQKPDKTKILKNGFSLSLSLVLIYTAGIILITRLFPSILPGSINKDIFNQIFIFMITGYSIYVIFHFPLNTYLFKVIDIEKQKRISFYFTIIIIVFAGVFYYIINYKPDITYNYLLLIIWFYIFILLAVKSVIMFLKKQPNDSGSETVISNDIQEIL